MKKIGLLVTASLMIIFIVPFSLVDSIKTRTEWEINLREIGQLNIGETAFDVRAEGDIVCLSYYTGYHIINVSDPTNPTELFHHHSSASGGIHQLDNDGNLLYIANFSDGLRILNISDPTHPIEIGHFNDGGNLWGLSVKDDLAYLADGGDGLEVCNVSDPTHPVEVGQYANFGLAMQVNIFNNLAYVSDLGSPLKILDITEPSNIT
ncbi:MAG: LVIVD repeat-containing protein, partial [Candidatus Hodarchaeota archaeon]